MKEQEIDDLERANKKLTERLDSAENRLQEMSFRMDALQAWMMSTTMPSPPVIDLTGEDEEEKEESVVSDSDKENEEESPLGSAIDLGGIGAREVMGEMFGEWTNVYNFSPLRQISPEL